MVRYGTSAKALTESATASSTTYSAADLCGPPATSFGWADPGQLHAALMTGLKPSRRYYYQYGSVSAADASAEPATLHPDCGMSVKPSAAIPAAILAA